MVLDASDDEFVLPYTPGEVHRLAGGCGRLVAQLQPGCVEASKSLSRFENNERELVQYMLTKQRLFVKPFNEALTLPSTVCLVPCLL